MHALTAVVFFSIPLLALPTEKDVHTLQDRAISFEWTAWGDSYASGVGSGTYINGRRCLRYEEAYPVWMSDDPENLFPGAANGKFNNVVCSGAKTEQVEQYQFYDADQNWGQPSWQFYPRPSSGSPTLGTLTVGGDDIDFPGILSNCIVDGFPLPLSLGFIERSCDDQAALSWSLIADGSNHNVPNPDLVNKIDHLIKKIVDYGEKASGPKFWLYVTGYGQFFNDQTTDCNDITFARTPNDGKPHNKMTLARRQDFNHMSRTLNTAILAAVNRNSLKNVRYVNIDDMLNGHRFCEPDVQEPDENNANNWIWHYPYSIKEDPADRVIQYLNSVVYAHATDPLWNDKKTLGVDMLNDFWSKVDEQQLSKAIELQNTTDINFWRDYVGQRARVFHPKLDYHKAIYRQIAQQYRLDSGSGTDAAASSSYAPGTCRMHVDEWELACQPDDHNLEANITIWDANGVRIGSTPELKGDILFPMINADNPFEMKSKLPAALVVTGQHAGDYVRFTLATTPQLSWTSRTTQADSPDAYCTNGGWNPRRGAGCFPYAPGFGNARNQIDCWFKC